MKSLCFVAAMLCAGTAFAAEGIDRFAFLAGCWTQEKAEPGSIEQWTAPAGGTMLGVSRTIRKGRTAEFEYLQIKEVEPGVWAYVPQPQGRPPTVFKLKSATESEIVFENLDHDFPQRIMYRKDGDGLRARIEGMSKGALKGIDFPMKKAACAG